MEILTPVLAFIDGLGGGEMMLIFILVLVLFGGDKLPEFARGLGKSIREFKKAAANVEDEFKRALEEDERKRTGTIQPQPAVTALPAHETAYGSDPALHDPSHPDYHYHDGSSPDYPGPGPSTQEAVATTGASATPPAAEPAGGVPPSAEGKPPLAPVQPATVPTSAAPAGSPNPPAP